MLSAASSVAALDGEEAGHCHRSVRDDPSLDTEHRENEEAGWQTPHAGDWEFRVEEGNPGWL